MLTPGVLALAVMSTAFTSLAIATGFERRYGVLKRLGASPLPRSGLLLGKVGALLLVEVAADRGDRRGRARARLATAVGPPASLGGRCSWSLLGTAAFASLGLLVAGALRAEATLAAANLVYLLLLAGGAVVLPATSYGGVRRRRRAAALRARSATAMRDGAPRRRLRLGRPLLVLVVWAARRHRPDREDLHVGVTVTATRLPGHAARRGRRWMRRWRSPRWSPTSCIVVTGGAVRLTGSGLGCPTWPRCTDAVVRRRTARSASTARSSSATGC